MAKNNLSVSILIAYLKHYGVRKLVLSPGMRNIPFVTTVEVDPFFECYSVVDERNAAFFALGLSQKSGEPVGLACTSGTAVSNYLTGLSEAYYSHAPIVAITCDRSPYVLGQLETQKVDQRAALKSAVKESIELPVLKDVDDVWYFERLLNEGLIALRRGLPGPVHFNMPLVGDTNALWDEGSRKKVESSMKFIDFVDLQDEAGFAAKRECLLASKRVMLVMGYTYPGNERLKKAIDCFCEIYHCPILADNLSNYRGENFISAEAVMKGLNGETFSSVIPDIVITFGMNFQERIKDLFKVNKGKSQHWGIDAEGKIRDCFKSQTAVFNCRPEEFFERMVEGSPVVSGDETYLSIWRSLEKAAQLPELPYGNFYAITEFCKAIPENALLHVSILNATRLVQFTRLPPTVEVFGNVNTFGIDGCLPTFMGQAAASDKPAFLIIGDVSFFYAMNALGIKHRNRNVHVLLINNGGAAEFHIPPTSHAVPTIDQHIGVAHNRTARGWAESLGYEYLSANDPKTLKTALQYFVRPDNDAPVLLEVFADMKRDGEFCLSVYRDLEEKVKPVMEGALHD